MTTATATASGGLINRVTGDITAIRLFAETIIIDTITNVANTEQDSSSSGERVFEVLDMPTAIYSSEKAERIEQVCNSVFYENVPFGFTDQRSTL